MELLKDYMDEFQPSTATQVTLVEIMAAARWRQLRVLGAQKTAMDLDMKLQTTNDVPERILCALRNSPELLLRYEIAFSRARSLQRFLGERRSVADLPLEGLRNR